MRIFLTGIHGYLGSRLAAHLGARNHEVSGSARGDMRLGEPFEEAVFDGFDVVIHAAHDLAPGAKERNLRGTRSWLEAAAKRGVRRQIFLSSYSARPDAPSEYGQTKHLLEQLFLHAGQTVLRPGLVIGNGGLFARQRTWLLRTPIMPLLGDGADPTAVIGIGHFLEAATAVMESGRDGAFNLFYAKQPTAREFARTVKASSGQPARFLTMPLGLALALARVARALRLSVPVTPEQIRSLSLNRSAAWRSDLEALLPGRQSEFTLEHALEALRSGL